MLPIIGVIAAVKIIGDLIEKHEKLAEAERHATEVSESLQIKQNDLALGLQAANLQLEDQIRKLEGRPATNVLALAMIAVKRSVDDLATTYATDFQKMDKNIEDQLGFWADMKRAAMDVVLVLDEMGGGEEGEASKRVKQNKEEVASLNALFAAQQRADAARKLVNEESLRDPEHITEAYRTALGALAVAVGKVQSAADAAHSAVNEVDADNKELLGTLTDKATLAKGEIAGIAAEFDKMGLEAKKANRELANVSAEKAAKDAKAALDKQILEIDNFKRAAEVAYNSGKADAASWAVAQVQATDAAAIAHESYLRRLVAIYKQAGEVQKAADAQKNLDEWLEKNTDILDHVSEAMVKASDEMKKYKEATHTVVEEYAHLIDAGVEKDFAATAKAAEQLTRAEEELLKAQSKLAEDKLAQHYKDQEAAITKLAQMHLITEEQKDDRLKLLEQQQASQAIEILTQQLAKEKAVMDAAAAQVAYAKANPFSFSPAQLAELEANLAKVTAAYTNTEDEIVQTQEKFNKQSEANDKSRYGRALLAAAAFGQEILAEQIKQNHAALIAAEGEEKQAKARGANTEAIKKEVEALKENEKALEKEARGGQVTRAEKQQNIKLALEAAQAALLEAKAHGANTIAMEQTVRQLQQLANITGQVTAGDKQLLTETIQSTEAQLRYAQAILVTIKARNGDTTAIDKEIKELQKLLSLLQQEPPKLTKLEQAMKTLQGTTQTAYAEMVTSVAGAMQAMITGQKTFGAAMEEATFKMLASMAQKWAEYFMGLAIGSWPNFAAMAEYTAAAVAMEALAGALGGLASGGASGGGVQPGAPSPGQTTMSSAGGGGGGTNQTAGVTHLAAGGIVTEPTTFMAGDSASGGAAAEAILPLSDSAAMRQIAEAIMPGMSRALGFTTGGYDSRLPAEKPRMMTAEASPSEKLADDFGTPSVGDRPSFDFSATPLPREMPDMQALAAQFGGLLSASTLRAASTRQAAVAAASTVAPAIFDEAAMERFATRLVEGQRNASNPAPAAGDTTHVHVNVKGMISPDNLNRVVKRINRAVGNRQATLNASNSLRLTRRSQ
jgi:hypothetical protein